MPEEIEVTEVTTEETDQVSVIAGLRAKIERLQSESASYRVQRNQALRESHALREVAKAHSADMDQMTEEALGNLKIANGKVDGEFSYKAPSLASQVTATPVQTKTPDTVAMDISSLATMSSKEINDNWDEVSQLLANQTR